MCYKPKWPKRVRSLTRSRSPDDEEVKVIEVPHVVNHPDLFPPPSRPLYPALQLTHGDVEAVGDAGHARWRHRTTERVGVIAVGPGEEDVVSGREEGRGLETGLHDVRDVCNAERLHRSISLLSLLHKPPVTQYTFNYLFTVYWRINNVSLTMGANKLQ